MTAFVLAIAIKSIWVITFILYMINSLTHPLTHVLYNDIHRSVTMPFTIVFFKVHYLIPTSMPMTYLIPSRGVMLMVKVT